MHVGSPAAAVAAFPVEARIHRPAAPCFHQVRIYRRARARARPPPRRRRKRARAAAPAARAPDQIRSVIRMNGRPLGKSSWTCARCRPPCLYRIALYLPGAAFAGSIMRRRPVARHARIQNAPRFNYLGCGSAVHLLNHVGPDDRAGRRASAS